MCPSFSSFVSRVFPHTFASFSPSFLFPIFCFAFIFCSSFCFLCSSSFFPFFFLHFLFVIVYFFSYLCSLRRIFSSLLPANFSHVFFIFFWSSYHRFHFLLLFRHYEYYTFRFTFSAFFLLFYSPFSIFVFCIAVNFFFFINPSLFSSSFVSPNPHLVSSSHTQGQRGGWDEGRELCLFPSWPSLCPVHSLRLSSVHASKVFV